VVIFDFSYRDYRMRRLIALIFSSLSLHAAAATVSDEVTAFLKQTMREQRIPALQVAVIRHNKIVQLDAYGTANVENAVPATRESIFSINSCTKAFTGVAIMQLVEAGKLGIDDTISLYLDDLPASWRAITVKQVLTHVSGLPNIIDSKENPIGDGSDASAWATVKTLPLEFPAGERFKYNQTGYVIIGKIIDKLSGQPFARFIEDRQFRVAGNHRAGAHAHQLHGARIQPKPAQPVQHLHGIRVVQPHTVARLPHQYHPVAAAIRHLQRWQRLQPTQPGADRAAQARLRAVEMQPKGRGLPLRDPNLIGHAQGFGVVGDPMGGRRVDRINGRFRHG